MESDMLQKILILKRAKIDGPDEKEAKRTFDNAIALSKILGGDLKALCLEKGMTEQQFDNLFTQRQRFAEFIDKHDSEGNLTLGEPGS